MGKQVYISDEEKVNCQKVADAFSELYEMENEDLVVLDAGKYGFVKLRYFKLPEGFDFLSVFLTVKVCLMPFGKSGWIYSS